MVKKGDTREHICEAFKEKRTVTEAKDYINEKYDVDISIKSIYYHIKQIKIEEKKLREKGNVLQTRLEHDGDRWQFISRKEEIQEDSSYFKWFIARYEEALEKRNQDELITLRAELEEFCHRKMHRILDENFLSFLVEIVQKDSYEFFESLGLNMDKYTFTTWDCIAYIISAWKQDLKFEYDEKIERIYNKYKSIDSFFGLIALDYNRKYGIERLEAFRKLTIMNSPIMYGVAFHLLTNIDPKNKIRFSRGKILKTNEFNLLKWRITWVVLCFINSFPIESRKILFALYQKRKEKFGNKDKIVKKLSEYMEMARNTEHEAKTQEIQEYERELFEFCKKAKIKPYELGMNMKYFKPY